LYPALRKRGLRDKYLILLVEYYAFLVNGVRKSVLMEGQLTVKDWVRVGKKALA
jgi:hypothetical protein